MNRKYVTCYVDLSENVPHMNIVVAKSELKAMRKSVNIHCRDERMTAKEIRQHNDADTLQAVLADRGLVVGAIEVLDF